jgi:uncharacterized protein (UPF0335 family)
MASAEKSNIDSVTISAGGKSVTMTPEQLKKAGEAAGGPRNTQKLTEGFIAELVAVEDEIEREMEPLKERRKDILNAAKDNQLDLDALKKSVKFKRADEKKRAKLRTIESNTQLYLSFVKIEY